MKLPHPSDEARPALDPSRFAAGMTRQLERLEAALAGGMPRAGWKIGMNVPEVQRRVGVPHAGLGWIHGDRVLTSGARLERPAGTRLHVEPELGIRVGSADPGAPDRLRIDALAPALEIVDYALPVAGLDDVIAGSMFHHAVVLGAPRPGPVPGDLTRRWPRLCVGSAAPIEPSRDDLVPEDLDGLVGFVQAFLERFGQSLIPGDWILSGCYLAEAPALGATDGVEMDFGPLGRVSVPANPPA